MIHEILNLPCVITVTLCVIKVVKGTKGLELLAAQVNDVMLSNLLSVSCKLTWRMLLQRLALHEFITNELELVDNGIIEFVSYIVRLTSGFEFIAVQNIG